MREPRAADLDRAPAQAGSPPPRIGLRPEKVLRWLSVAIVLLIAASLAGTISRLYFGHDNLLGFIPLFNVDVEANVPTWYSASALLLAALLLGIIWRAQTARGERFSRHWGALALVFVYLSADEGGHIHEVISTPARFDEFMAAYGQLTWLIPNGLGLLALCLIYRRFVFALPKDVLRPAFASAVVFVAGAVGTELIGWLYRQSNPSGLTSELITLAEESLEMFGVALFIYALLVFIARHIPPFEVSGVDAPGRDHRTRP
ncbi:MAG TPA: hypothetical protein VJ596_08350 [Gemmatimonadaceae bacterium]|nr:hypothetical protein [Gemmatimonadaceae bacterium]